MPDLGREGGVRGRSCKVRRSHFCILRFFSIIVTGTSSAPRLAVPGCNPVTSFPHTFSVFGKKDPEPQSLVFPKEKERGQVQPTDLRHLVKFCFFHLIRGKHERTNLVSDPNPSCPFPRQTVTWPQMICPGHTMLLLESEDLSAKDHAPSRWL